MIMCMYTSFVNRESRYLLFLTENYAALQVLLQHLKDVIMSHTRSGKGVEPYVLFGSSFPKDKEYTQVMQEQCTKYLQYACHYKIL